MKKTSLWGLLKAYVFNGGRKGCAEYVLDVANSAVAALSDATKEKITVILGVMASCLAYLKKFEKYIPADWLAYYTPCVDALTCVVDVLTDLKVESKELSEVAQRFQLAYAAFKAD